jgi:hypothetical protein
MPKIRNIGLFIGLLLLLTQMGSLSAQGDSDQQQALTIEKFVAIAGGAWYTADFSPGLPIPEGKQVSFRFVVTNTATETATNITLTDSLYSIDGCQIPVEIAPDDGFECIAGPFDIEQGDDDDDEVRIVNVATVTAQINGATVTATDEAHYYVDQDDDTDVVIIIEGPVEVIIANVIIIYGIEIELDEDDPLLLVIQIGDIIRVEGDVDDSDGVIVVIAIIIVIVDVDIVVGGDGQVWREDDCGNPPPPWAPAHGWRRKCQPEGGNNGRGGGRGRGNDDGDGDDD